MTSVSLNLNIMCLQCRLSGKDVVENEANCQCRTTRRIKNSLRSL